MRQFRFTLENFVPQGEDPDIPDTYMDPKDLAEIKSLAGIISTNPAPVVQEGENISHTAMKRVEYMKKHNIQPGTEDWFRLWFSKPYLTGDTGMNQ